MGGGGQIDAIFLRCLTLEALNMTTLPTSDMDAEQAELRITLRKFVSLKTLRKLEKFIDESVIKREKFVFYTLLARSV
jgi:hypothetical protein